MAARDQLRAGIVRLPGCRPSRARDRAAFARRAFFQRTAISRASWRHSPEQCLATGLEHMAAPARCSKPVIAANRGYCFWRAASSCRWRATSASPPRPRGTRCRSRKLGQIPGSGGSARLQKDGGHRPHQGHRDALAPHLGQARAYEWGIAVECVADAELEAATDALVDELRGFSPLAQRTAKKLLNDTEDAPLSIAIELEGHCYSRLRSSDDFREGVEAFHGKRKPAFRGS
ncbi:enoyl-CoA hydratase/isomerase family protein [Cupriavidus basilensis]